jgi:hypothetical protein
MPIDAGFDGLVVRAVDTGLRPVRLVRPFRFGAVTLQACPQLFVRVQLEVRGRVMPGFAAEMMVPKWFDKRPAFSQQENVAQLAASVEVAAAAYSNDRPATAFGLFDRHYAALMQAGTQTGMTALTAAYGQAVLDRAVVDALCRGLGLSFFQAAANNAFGLADSTNAPDMRGFDWNAWLPTLAPLRRIAVRHTVGMLDSLDELAADIDAQGLRYFKIKLGGDPVVDAERLSALLPLLDQKAPGHRFSLDGNEQYPSLEPLLGVLPDHPALLYVEQPIPRDAALSGRLPTAPLLMDEADGTLGAFVRGRGEGWTGVSSKSCKGLYKAMINRARCTRWNDDARRDGQPARFFMSAEDLTCQAGLSVQQDLALASLLGLSHSERNGHHYHPGFGAAPAAEQQAFAAAHSDLYRGDPPALAIADGALRLDSLFAPGFAHAADPDVSSLQPLAAAASML